MERQEIILSDFRPSRSRYAQAGIVHMVWRLRRDLPRFKSLRESIACPACEAMDSQSVAWIMRRKLIINARQSLGIPSDAACEAWIRADGIWIRRQGSGGIAHSPWEEMSAHEILEAEDAAGDGRFGCVHFADDINPGGDVE